MLGYINYLLTESDLCLYGKNTDRELAVLAERYGNRRQCGSAKVYDFECSLSYVCHMQCFSGPIIRPWSLSENNVLELANQSTRYIVNKLNPMISRTNLYIFFTIQLCMYFMEGQERKIHWATMIKCSTMLLAGLIYWITCRMLVVLKWMKKRSQVELLWKEISAFPNPSRTHYLPEYV